MSFVKSLRTDIHGAFNNYLKKSDARLRKLYIIITLFMLFLPISIAYYHNESGYILTFEHGSGFARQNSSDISMAIMAGGQLTTFTDINSTISLKEGLFKTAYEYIPPILPIYIGGSSPPSSNLTTWYYDVKIQTEYDIYYIGEKIKATITFINLGREPDRDSRLAYYLLNNQKKHLESIEYFEQVKPGKTEYKVNITLPINSKLGEWHFCADYETYVQSRLTVCDAFQITNDTNILRRRMYKNIIVYSLIIIGIVGLLISLFGLPKLKKVIQGDTS